MKLLKSIRKRINNFRSFPQIATHRNATFILDPHDKLDGKILAGHSFEADRIDFALKRISSGHLTHVVDIGANFGLYSVLLGMQSAVQEVYAFEPIQRTFNQLCANIYANNLSAKVQAFKYALSDRDYYAQMHLAQGHSTISRLDIGDKPGQFDSTEVVDVRRGDDMLQISNKKIFIKIDVEGHGNAVLRGMQQILSSNTGVLMIEAECDDKELIEVLSAVGWHEMPAGLPDRIFEKPSVGSS